MQSQVEWGQYALSPHYRSLGHGSFAEAMLWISEGVMFREMTNVSTVDDVFTHLTEDGGGGGRLLDSADLLPLLKYRDDQCLFQEKWIRPRSSEICMMRVTAGATSTISYINQEVHLWDMLFCSFLWDLRLQSSLVTWEMVTVISSI